jgi:hypothetical protein
MARKPIQKPAAPRPVLPTGVKPSAKQDPKTKRWLSGPDIAASGGRNIAHSAVASK